MITKVKVMLWLINLITLSRWPIIPSGTHSPSSLKLVASTGGGGLSSGALHSRDSFTVSFAFRCWEALLILFSICLSCFFNWDISNEAAWYSSSASVAPSLSPICIKYVLFFCASFDLFSASSSLTSKPALISSKFFPCSSEAFPPSTAKYSNEIKMY